MPLGRATIQTAKVVQCRAVRLLIAAVTLSHPMGRLLSSCAVALTFEFRSSPVSSCPPAHRSRHALTSLSFLVFIGRVAPQFKLRKFGERGIRTLDAE